LPLTEKDCFVVKGSVGYYTGNIYKPFDSIENANLFLMDLESAKNVKDSYSRYCKCEIIPVRATITERKKLDILCYFINPAHGNGWCFHTEDHLGQRWLIKGVRNFTALTD